MIIYEWDIETVDEYGDIIDHYHASDLQELAIFLEREEPQAGIEYRLVLVRDQCRADGMDLDRTWAYLTDECNLPSHFSDTIGTNRTQVSLRFAKELEDIRHRLVAALKHANGTGVTQCTQ